MDSENDIFKPEWELQFFFVLPEHTDAKPTCLICSQTVALIMSGNLKRHFSCKHSSYDQQFPLGSDEKNRNVKQLKASLGTGQQCMKRVTTEQEKTTQASLKVIWILGRAKNSFVSSETVKKCLVGMVSTLFPSDAKVIQAVKSIPLSATTNVRRNVRIKLKQEISVLSGSVRICRHDRLLSTVCIYSFLVFF